MEQAHAQNNQTFNLQFCNNSGGVVQISFAHHVNAQDNRFVVHGWYQLDPGCIQVPDMPRGWFYYFALTQDGSGFWGGDTNICVGTKQFEQIITDGYVCKADEVIVGFAGAQVNTPNFTLPDQPVARPGALTAALSNSKGETRERVSP